MKKFTSGLVLGLLLPTFIVPIIDTAAQYIINAIGLKASKETRDAGFLPEEEKEEYHPPQIGFCIDSTEEEYYDDEEEGE